MTTRVGYRRFTARFARSERKWRNVRKDSGFADRARHDRARRAERLVALGPVARAVGGGCGPLSGPPPAAPGGGGGGGCGFPYAARPLPFRQQAVSNRVLADTLSSAP